MIKFSHDATTNTGTQASPTMLSIWLVMNSWLYNDKKGEYGLKGFVIAIKSKETRNKTDPGTNKH